MKKILVVEDSPIVMKVLKHVLSTDTTFQPIYATSFAEAKNAVEQHEGEIFAGLIDLNLPDAPNGEVVDYTLENGIPTIVLTGSFSDEKREKLLSKGIVDYVTKEGRFSYEYALGVLKRLVKNQYIKVLVVDDSDTARKFISTLLRIHMYQVLEANDGVQAVKVLLENPDIKLLITDFNMPRMDGCELVKNIRHKYEKSDLVIIGLSSESEGTLSARFIKNGANDFLRKPFHHEEFYCRISHNVEFLELIESIKDRASRDDLTGAYNRKYFYEQAQDLFAEAQNNGTPISGAILDLDNFYAINNEYGHDVGDMALVGVVNEFNSLLEHFIYARADGNEFYLLMPGLDNNKALSFVERVRQIFGANAINVDGALIPITFSAGVSSMTSGTLDDLFREAADSMKRAKEAGGDLVFSSDDE